MKLWDVGTGSECESMRLEGTMIPFVEPSSWEKLRALQRIDDNSLAVTNPRAGVTLAAFDAAGSCTNPGLGHGTGSLVSMFEVAVDLSEKGEMLAVNEWGLKFTSSVPDFVPQWVYTILPRKYLNIQMTNEYTLTCFDLRTGQIRVRLPRYAFGSFSANGRVMATFTVPTDDKHFREGFQEMQIWELPIGAPWFSIFAWSLLPAGLLYVLGLCRPWRVFRRTQADPAHGVEAN
jgi:hypothetical protein